MLSFSKFQCSMKITSFSIFSMKASICPDNTCRMVLTPTTVVGRLKDVLVLREVEYLESQDQLQLDLKIVVSLILVINCPYINCLKCR